MDYFRQPSLFSWSGRQRRALPLALQTILAFALVVPLGPLLYRVAYRPVAQASVLVLLIISVAVHLALTGVGLILFGAEGSRTPPFSEARWQIGPLQVTGQALCVVGGEYPFHRGLVLVLQSNIPR